MEALKSDKFMFIWESLPSNLILQTNMITEVLNRICQNMTGKNLRFSLDMQQSKLQKEIMEFFLFGSPSLAYFNLEFIKLSTNLFCAKLINFTIEQ